MSAIRDAAARKALAGLISVVAMVLWGAQSVCGVTTQADTWTTVDKVGNARSSEPAPGQIMVKFSSSSVPQLASLTVVPGSSDADESFTGNYAAARVNSVSFSITAVGALPGNGTALILRSGDRTWNRYDLAVEVGGTAANRVSLNRADGWQTQAEGDLDALWASDLRKVDFIGIRVNRGGVPAGQEFTIADFALEGDRTVGALSPLEEALLEAFGVSSLADVTPAQALLDSDGDGMTDLNEILAENDSAYFAENLFKVSVVASEDGFTVQWACVAGETYTVLKAGSMRGAFEAVSTPTKADETGYMSFTDVDIEDGMQYFYKVEQQ
jgi:hypothetical protein